MLSVFFKMKNDNLGAYFTIVKNEKKKAKLVKDLYMHQSIKLFDI